LTKSSDGRESRVAVAAAGGPGRGRPRLRGAAAPRGQPGRAPVRQLPGV